MKPGLGFFAGLPAASLLPGSVNFQWIAIATCTVVVVVAILLFILAFAGKRPRLTWGRFSFETDSGNDRGAETQNTSDPTA